MPAPVSTGTGIVANVVILFSKRESGRFVRVDAECHDVEFFPCSEWEDVHRRYETVQLHAAEHRTFVINRHKDDRLRTEEITELYGTPIFIAKRDVRINMDAEVLIDADQRCERLLQK